MPKTSWITAEITRRAFLTVEAEDRDEARAMAESLLEEGGFEGWDEDVPDVMVEEIPEGSASPLACSGQEEPCQPV